MSCDVCEDRAIERHRHFLQRAVHFAGWFAGRLSRVPKLDLDAAPDRIKRDLGFLDGREPQHYEDERRR
jgi:hypothetical protein